MESRGVEGRGPTRSSLGAEDKHNGPIIIIEVHRPYHFGAMDRKVEDSDRK